MSEDVARWCFCGLILLCNSIGLVFGSILPLVLVLCFLPLLPLFSWLLFAVCCLHTWLCCNLLFYQQAGSADTLQDSPVQFEAVLIVDHGWLDRQQCSDDEVLQPGSGTGQEVSMRRGHTVTQSHAAGWCVTPRGHTVTATRRSHSQVGLLVAGVWDCLCCWAHLYVVEELVGCFCPVS